MNIVYVCPEYPYPSNTGGKRVFASNIDKLVSSGEFCHIFLFNNSIDDLSEEQLSYKISLKRNTQVLSVNMLSREAANYHHKGLFALTSLARSLFSFIPRALFVRRVSLCNEYKKIFENADKIIIDHAAAFGCIPKKYWFDKRVVYISHNIETKILREQLQEKSGFVMRIISSLDYFKMLWVEKQILHRLPLIHFISNNDMDEANELTSRRHGRYIYTPFVIPPKQERWQYKPQMSNLRALFVGGTDYFPNFDAAKWLVEHFAVNYPHVQLELVGKNEELVSYIEKENIKLDNVILHGRVTDEQLENLFLSCSFFISPVVLGSGIKIKVLEAASYGIPILATRESMIGLSFIRGVFLIDRYNSSFELLSANSCRVEELLQTASESISHSMIEVEMVDNDDFN